MSEYKRKLIFLNLIITTFSSSLLATAMVVALPHIAEDLQVSLATGQWVTSGFTLASAIIMPLSAYLITRIATRRLYLASLVLIIIGLGICAVAQTFSVMIGGRILQAASGGVLGAIAQVILLTVYPKEQHGTIMGWYGMAIGFAPVIAPTIGGILMDIASWRMIFVLSIALMLFALISAIFVFDDFLATTVRKFDIYSFTLSAFAFGGITLGAGNMSNFGISDPFTFLPLVIGVVTGIMFVQRQLKLSVPLFDVRLLQNRTFALATVSGMLHNFVMMGAAILMPTYAQTIFHYSATQAGLFMLIPSLCFALVSPIAGKIYDNLGIRNLYIFSALGLFISNGVMAFANESWSVIIITLIYCLRNAALGVLMMPITTWGMGAISKEQYAQGTAVLNAFRNVAGAIGSAVVIGFMAMVTEMNAGSPQAVMYGFNAAFGFVCLSTILMLIIAFFFVKAGKE